jgi:aqualysin 1
MVVSLTLLASIGVTQSFAQPPTDVPADYRGESYPIPGRYIVVFKSRVADPAAEARNLMRGHRGQIHHTYSYAIKGFSATLPEAAYNAILKNPNVDYVEQDATVYAWETTTQTGATWGIDRIDQTDLPLNQSYTYDQNGAGVLAYIIDTGIRASHVEFTGRIASGFTAILDGRGTADCNGHGTHVAGTVGGTLYGVAKGVTLVPVRVLDCRGSGSWSGVIAGVDWVTGQKKNDPNTPMVANMSLGGGASSAVDDAVTKSIDRRCGLRGRGRQQQRQRLQLFPGAGGQRAHGRLDHQQRCALLLLELRHLRRSLRPRKLDHLGLAYQQHAINTISGTSMASPHVAGVAALVLSGKPTATTSEVSTAIVNGATSVTRSRSPGTGSPNLLLYSRLSAGDTPPTAETPPPSNDTEKPVIESLVS